MENLWKFILLVLFIIYSPVSGALIDDEYNLQDHSDLYILDLGKQGFNLNKLWVFLLNPVLKTLEKELLRFQAGLVSRLDQNSVINLKYVLLSGPNNVGRAVQTF